MQYLSRLYAVFFIAMMLLGCSTEAPVSADLAGNGTTLAKKGHDDDDCGCGKIKAKLLATAQINPPLLTATGEMRGDLQGTVNYVANLADVVPLTSSVGNDPVKPSASLIGTWTLTTKNGVLTFRDVGAFEQVPNGIGTSFSTVIDGTGCYSGASGFLFVSFVADETGLIFKEEHRGEIFCPKHNDGDAAPDIAAVPTRLDFGKVAVGSSKDKTFVLKNDGTTDLKINKKQVAGSNAEQYEVLDLDVPAVLAPGESREVTVRFSPTSSGIKKGQVKLFSNDPDENHFPVSFKGEGISGP